MRRIQYLLGKGIVGEEGTTVGIIDCEHVHKGEHGQASKEEISEWVR